MSKSLLNMLATDKETCIKIGSALGMGYMGQNIHSSEFAEITYGYKGSTWMLYVQDSGDILLYERDRTTENSFENYFKIVRILIDNNYDIQ